MVRICPYSFTQQWIVAAQLKWVKFTGASMVASLILQRSVEFRSLGVSKRYLLARRYQQMKKIDGLEEGHSPESVMKVRWNGCGQDGSGLLLRDGLHVVQTRIPICTMVRSQAQTQRSYWRLFPWSAYGPSGTASDGPMVWSVRIENGNVGLW